MRVSAQKEPDKSERSLPCLRHRRKGARCSLRQTAHAVTCRMYGDRFAIDRKAHFSFRNPSKNPTESVRLPLSIRADGTIKARSSGLFLTERHQHDGGNDHGYGEPIFPIRLFFKDKKIEQGHKNDVAAARNGKKHRRGQTFRAFQRADERAAAR